MLGNSRQSWILDSKLDYRFLWPSGLQILEEDGHYILAEFMIPEAKL